MDRPVLLHDDRAVHPLRRVHHADVAVLPGLNERQAVALGQAGRGAPIRGTTPVAPPRSVFHAAHAFWPARTAAACAPCARRATDAGDPITRSFTTTVPDIAGPWIR